MDKVYWNPDNTGYYYNQILQEDAQHTSHPETGHGVAATGASGSHPAPGQSQLYPNSPAPIPSSPGMDWECLLRTPQPTPLEEIILRTPQAEQRFREVPVRGASGQPHLNPNTPAPIPSSPGMDLEYFLRTFQPTILDEINQSEAGQTSTGVPVNRASENPFAPGQPYLNPNTQILPSPRPDPEYLAHAPQPIAEQDIIQSDALPEPSNPQPGSKKRSRKPNREPCKIKEEFMEGLTAFEQGALLTKCSPSPFFRNYVHRNGDLSKKGQALYSTLTPPEKMRVDQAIIARKGALLGQLTDKETVKERFMAGLNNYARGAKLVDCSATLSFNFYVSSDGRLHKSGKELYSGLPPEEKELVNQALTSRKIFHEQCTAAYSTIKERFLAGLDKYAQGARLMECSTAILFRHYASEDGRLHKPGQELRAGMSPKDQDRVDQALANRKMIIAQRTSVDVGKFMDTLKPYADGLPLPACGKQSGLKRKVHTYLTQEGGLTPKGDRLIENLQPDQRNEVCNAIKKRQQRTESSIPVFERPRQRPDIPSSMPEMPEINQTEVDDPMQMETMFATVWQLTGQSMQGTWGDLRSQRNPA
jgi:hypothetical protein